ncbi:MAG: oligopeptidase B, partial [Actinomycetales bacterium]
MNLIPPVAARIPTKRTHHGDTFIDELEWLRDKTNPEVLAHLTAENVYTDEITADQQELRDTIFDEIKNRTQETDLSVPSRRFGWWYFARTTEGKQYPSYCRLAIKGANDWTPPVIEAGVELDGEQLLLDCNAEAEGKPFFSLGGFTVTKDGNLLAYCEDNSGDERYTLRIKDLTTGEMLPDVIENIFSGLLWSPKGDKIFYTMVDSSWRPYQLRCHTLGTPVSEDEIIYTEEHPGFWMSADLSADHNMLLITVGNAEYGETWAMDLTDPEASPQLLISRKLKLLHGVDPAIINGHQVFF